jgi:hypothetical protein
MYSSQCLLPGLIREGTAAIQQLIHIGIAAVHDVSAFIPLFVFIRVISAASEFFGDSTNRVFDVCVSSSLRRKRTAAAFFEGSMAVLLCKSQNPYTKPVGLYFQFAAFQNPLDQFRRMWSDR